MAEQFECLSESHKEFIQQQHIFFVGTACSDGRVNVSPKGTDSFRILDSHRIAWLNLTGSGNETAAHVLEDGRMTIMFCSFDKQPMILRLYGKAKVYHPRDSQWSEFDALFPLDKGARQIFELQLDLVQTSCGFSIPFYEFLGERATLKNWSEKQGSEGVESYWEKNNQLSMDGKPTGIFERSDADNI